MDLQKLAHDIFGASGQTHLPFFLGLIAPLKMAFKMKSKDDLGDLGDVPGDNIPPKQILISLSSRREISGRL